jgi:hypothetical protein
MNRPKKIRYIDYLTQQHITEGKDEGQVFEKGTMISPFDTKHGRVAWEVAYVEDVDIDMKMVYIINKGFYNK